MSKIQEAFRNGKAFIPFITCGDPDLETTAACVRAAVAGGADLIELGIPFSDPTAEGPVIQGANLRALSGGVTTDAVFGLVRELRKEISIPLVFMTYANVVFSYGSDRFLAACSEAGINGLILPDLPFEEKEEFLPDCRKYGVDLISLIAPTSANRIAMIAREAEGFPVYCFQPGRDGNPQRDYHRPGIDRPGGEGEYGGPLRDRLRHFHPGAGKKPGRTGGRRDCRIGHCPADRRVWAGRGRTGGRIRPENEEGGQ
jgi:tryptophan synthase, alpha chain (EC 4.2.1.20)